MKYVLLLVMLVCGVAQADDSTWVFQCNTAKGELIFLTRDEKTDEFKLLYGSDLTHPKRSFVAYGKNMGTSFIHASGENVDNREVYMNTKAGYATLGMNDFGDHLEAYLKVEQKENDPNPLRAQCRNDTIVEAFRDPNSTVFQNMTEVDNY
jgi:hypothetical protein